MILRHFGGKLGIKWGFSEFFKSGLAERKFCLVPPPQKINNFTKYYNAYL